MVLHQQCDSATLIKLILIIIIIIIIIVIIIIIIASRMIFVNRSLE